MLATLAVRSSDAFSVVRKVIGPSTVEVLNDLRGFLSRFESSLPPPAVEALKRISTFSPNLSDDTAALGHLQVIAAVLSVASDVTFHVADPDIAGRRLVERAFLHLNRSLVVNEQLCRQWGAAFDAGETRCEKLGAVHLLAHGIWAFKASAAGAATDLILSERPLAGAGLDLSVAEYLVLTEWKRVLSENEVPGVATAARKQAEAYAGGLLGGVELRTVRYVVLVSRKPILGLPDDVVGLSGVTIRHLNVAIETETPAAVGKRARRLRTAD
jgi:hypothetical protein